MKTSVHGCRWCVVGVSLIWIAVGPMTAGAAEIAPGVDYTVYAAPGPNVVYVVAVERERGEYKLKVGWPHKKRNFPSRQSTGTIANLYHDSPDHSVLAAVNGSFFGSGIDIIGTAASDGEMLQHPDGANHTFFFGPSRQPLIRANLAHAVGTLSFANGNSIPLGHYNRPNPPIHAVTAYTPQWDTSTGSSFINNSIGVEVILQDVTYPMRGSKEVSGIVTAIRTGSASHNNPIPAGGMVLTAWGSTRTDILDNTQVGDRLRMRFATNAWESNIADMAITGIGWIVKDGAPNSSQWPSAGFPGERHPRTVLASNDTHVFLVAIDGRSTASVGMTFTEMADFLIGTLGATDAVNLDGGGSTTMIVEGQLKNVPSDGPQRPVANAVLLVREDTATTFPFSDPFGAGGRLPGWDDKFTFNEVIPFAPSPPGGDGHVVVVADPAGGVETMRHGDFNDEDYTVEADIYCAYRPEVAADGFERYGLFARDAGTGAFGLSSFGGGNCYALTYDSHDGRVRAGKYVNGVFTDFLDGSPVHLPETAWRRFRIDCYGSMIQYRVDGALLVSVVDTTYARGYFGLGYHAFFTDNANIDGTRADGLIAYVDAPPPPVPGDFDDDGDVDMDDFGHFQWCLSGSSVPQPDPACAGARLDGDSDVDEADLILFLECMSGANVPADPDCLGTP